MAEEDEVTVEDHTVLDEEDIANPYPDPSGSDSLLSLSDQQSVARQLQAFDGLIAEHIKGLREFYAALGKNAILLTNPNQSGHVQFRTFRFGAGSQPIMICREKAIRGNIVLHLRGTTNGSSPVVSIGLHVGITPGGLDTIALEMGEYRTIRTTQALWATVDSVTNNPILDVQEEFE